MGNPSKIQEDLREKDLYIRALRSLDKAGKVSDHHQVAIQPQEIDLMRESQRLATRATSQFPYADGQYERIFGGS